MKDKTDKTFTDLVEIVDAILEGTPPKLLPEAVVFDVDNPLHALSEKINTLRNQYGVSYQYILSLASGKLDIDSPTNIFFANPYKQLHSELRHLTWQIQQIADGDYDQYVSFSGDFSQTINKMIEALRERQRLTEIIKENEELLRKNTKELEEINQAKDKLFSIIAHDLKSPLYSLTELSEILLEEIAEGSFENVKEYVTIFNKSVSRTYDLITNLLQWARVQSGKITMTPKTFSLNELVNTNIETGNISAIPKNITLDFVSEQEYTVFSDEEIINTILRNLLSNAIKYTYPGGNITVTIHPTTEAYEVSVTDTGTGIEKEKVAKIFNIDEGSTPGTNDEKGTGLGLTLCKEFVGKIGGKIWVKSTYGKGSTFTFSIPRT